MSTWVIGDLHGCGKELEELFLQADIGDSDQVWLVGDCFDRGLHGHVVWKMIRQHGIRIVLGNHENKFIKWLSGRKADVPMHYIWTVNNLVKNGISISEFFDFIQSAPLVSEAAPGVVVTHAGVLLHNPLQPDESANVYGRAIRDKEEWWDYYHGDKVICYGHLVSSGGPRIRTGPNGQVNSVGLDTATVHGGPATAYCVETGKIVQYTSGVDYFSQLKGEFKKASPTICQEVADFIGTGGKSRLQRLTDEISQSTVTTELSNGLKVSNCPIPDAVQRVISKNLEGL